MTETKFDVPNKSCSFCGKEHSTVEFLITGPNVNICDQCIDLCKDMVDKDRANKPITDELKGLPTPSQITTYLNDYVVGQEDAKKYLSVAVYNHYKRVLHENHKDSVANEKSNILMIGPTGSGKTLLAESLAKLLKVPFATVDATTLTEAGYVGDDVVNILSKLYQNADGDIEKAERGIVYIDEIDKKRKQYGMTNRDVSGEGVQQALLKFIDGGTFEVPMSSSRDKNMFQQNVTINTKNILFICGGAFVGLDKTIGTRLDKKVIGFDSIDASNKDKDSAKDFDYLMSLVEPNDLSSFGIIPELLGRLPIVVTLKSLKEDDLVQILTEPKDALISQYVRSFKKDNHNLVFEDDALREIARISISKNMGARGLRTILEKILVDLQYTIPDEKDKDGDKEIVITRDFVLDRINSKQLKKNSM